MYDIFLISNNPLDIKTIRDRFPLSKHATTLDEARRKTFTNLFWVVYNDLRILDNFDFDFKVPTWDQQYIHVFKNAEHYDGIALIPKDARVSTREFEYRFYAEKKEIDIIASVPKPYDIFTIDTYEDYQYALENSTTEMFWIIPKEVQPVDTFKFNLYFSKKGNQYEFERKINHAFKHMFNNKETYNGIKLMSKHKPVLKREIDYRISIEKIEHNIIASIHKRYDIVFISYNEPNADDNYSLIFQKFDNVKRVHGVKGIHQAHIEAAKLVDTDMFWVVDGDAIIKDNFNFDLAVSRYERDIVFTWQSENPVNGLVYGYGGVKLLPTKMTLEMDVNSPDMTTAISNKFKVVNTVSNITAFNTDPFNTWKSAFRECVKLASKTIQGQVDAETEERLTTWCTVVNGDFAIHALRGANAGRIYGQENAGNLPALSKINDFDWLEQQFKLTSVLR